MQLLSRQEAFDLILKDAPQDAKFLFDCDGTLIRGDINSACFKSLLPLGLIDDHMMPEEWQNKSFFALGDGDFEELQKLLFKKYGLRGAFEWEIKAFQGLPRATVREMSKKVLTNPHNPHHIETHTDAWHLAEIVKERAWIVSGSEHSCIEGVADLIGIDRSRVVATQLQEVDGIMRPAFEEPGINWEENKVKSLALRNIHSAYLCAGDSTGDWQLLHLATNWRWCVIEIGAGIPDYKRIFRDRILDELKISLSSLSLGRYAIQPGSGTPSTILQVVIHHP